tara:strand:+ start:386 stop:769 length:384 start_codon:yes stop_codon:yes gene_type:complete
MDINEVVEKEEFKDVLSACEFGRLKAYQLLSKQNIQYIPQGTKIKFIDRQTYKLYKGGTFVRSTKNYLFISVSGYTKGKKCHYSKIVYPEFSYILYKEPNKLTMGDQLTYLLQGLESNSITITKLPI